EEMVHFVAQGIGGLLDTGVPVVPAGRQQIVGVAAMARQLHAVHREAGVVQALAEQPHFHRRAGEAVDQEDAAAVAQKEKIGLADHAVTPAGTCGKARIASFHPAFLRKRTITPWPTRGTCASSKARTHSTVRLLARFPGSSSSLDAPSMGPMRSTCACH